jgi:hypothetical protein
VWDFLREMALTFGWQADGTTYALAAKQRIDSAARRNYEAGDALDRKDVGADDALNWSRGLAMARRSPHFATIVANWAEQHGGASQVNEAQLAAFVDGFIEYAARGAFSFAASRKQPAQPEV